MLASLVASNTAFAQLITSSTNSNEDRWSVGITEGYHGSRLKFSELDNDNERLSSGVFGLFFQYEFLQERQLAIRPELSYLKRGGKLLDVNQRFFTTTDEETEKTYSLKSNYLDLRVPVIYQLGKHGGVRPYVFAAPELGFSLGGDIDVRQEFEDGLYEGYNLELNESNISKIYFGIAAGLGVKCPLYINQNLSYLGFEASYEIGINDTYSSDEKDGKAQVNDDYFNKKHIVGTRKMNGFEMKVTLSMPLSAFKKKAPVVIPQHDVVVTIPEPVVEEVPEKECYELDEIIQMSYRKEPIEGKTICAIDCINFEYNKSAITPDSYSYLNKLALFLATSQRKMEVKGHTDNIGTDAFNMRLSQERAEAVVKYLVDKGVDANNLTYSYYGKSRPLGTNDTEEGRRRNRRVEFEIK